MTLSPRPLRMRAVLHGRLGNPRELVDRYLAMPRHDVFTTATLRNLVFGVYVLFVMMSWWLFNAGQPAGAIDPESSVQGSAITQVLLIAVLLFSLLVAWRTNLRLARAWQIGAPYLPLIALAAASVVWATYPDLAGRRVIRMVVEFASIVLLVSTFPNRITVLRVLFWTLALLTMLDVAVLGKPSSFGVDGFAGVHGNKNIMGEAAFFDIPFFILAACDRRIVRYRVIPILLLIASVFFLVISQSKTALGTTVACCVLGLALRAYHSRYKWLAAAVLLIICLVATVLGVVFNFSINDIAVAATGDPTFTGRQYLWDYSVRRISEAPFFGHGYGSVWSIGGEKKPWLEASNIFWDPDQAHNGYLDLALQLGIMGIIAFALSLVVEVVRLGWAFARRRDVPHFVFGSYVIVGFLICNAMESTVFRNGSWLWISYLIVCFSNCLPATESPADARHGTRALPLRPVAAEYSAEQMRELPAAAHDDVRRTK